MTADQLRLRALEAELRAIEGTSIDATPIIQKMIDLSAKLGKRTFRIDGGASA